MARFARVDWQGTAVFIEHREGTWHVLSAAPWVSGATSIGHLVTEPTAFLVPTTPSKIVAIGQNYAKHAAEMGKPVPAEPLIFMKPVSALNAHHSAIVMPQASNDVHYEAELGLVIGKRLSRASEAEARDGIFGLTCFNDVTARDIQRREVQHTRAKSYDTFACCGPFLVTGLDPSNLRVQCRVNGVTKQDGQTSDMVFSPAKLVSFISHVMTLEPGDLISTGTPSGVGPLQPGDVVEVELEHLGVLSNPVRR